MSRIALSRTALTPSIIKGLKFPPPHLLPSNDTRWVATWDSEEPGLHVRTYYNGVKKFGVSYRGMDLIGKPIKVKGVVTAKRQEGGENLVDLDVWTEDADGKKTTPGTGVVALPSKS